MIQRKENLFEGQQHCHEPLLNQFPDKDSWTHLLGHFALVQVGKRRRGGPGAGACRNPAAGCFWGARSLREIGYGGRRQEPGLRPRLQNQPPGCCLQQRRPQGRPHPGTKQKGGGEEASELANLSCLFFLPHFLLCSSNPNPPASGFPPLSG